MGLSEYFLSIIAAAGGIGTVGFVLRPFAKTLRKSWNERCRRKSFVQEEKARRETRVAEIEAAGKADAARIREAGRVLRSLAKLEPDWAERLPGHLERVRPPPDELQPPAASQGVTSAGRLRTSGALGVLDGTSWALSTPRQPSGGLARGRLPCSNQPSRPGDSS